MPIHRLNHAVLFVRDVQRSADFYREVLGFTPIDGTDALRGAAFLRAPRSTNDHDLGLFEIGAAAGDSPAGRSTVGLYHLAWEVETLADLQELAAALAERGALVGASDHSTTKSLYGRDPDGIEFEIAWIVPAALLDDETVRARAGIKPLDLEREIARYGAETQGGIGISRALVAP
jgi:catechol-2,3-dioxygenase